MRKSVTPASTSAGTLRHRGVEIDAPSSVRTSRQRADDLEPGRVAALLVEQVAHRGDAGDGVGGGVAPRDPAGPEPGEAARDPPVHRAADPDRHAAGLQRLGHLVDVLEPEQVVGVRRRAARARASGTPRACGRGGRPRPVELEPGGLVLLALPADADAEVEAAAREHVEGRRRLGQHHRAPQRGDEDVGAEADARASCPRSPTAW